ncbi:MAG: acylglycerol kinase family protein [Candidatus Nomurabacteria bacterium]|jgi:hypothetical protein|nr:acylglycerol kinase family protein [Candidatus Nomurabacteria bacterium]
MLNFSRLVVIYSPKSTRAAKYLSKIQPELKSFANIHRAEFFEITPVDLPYFETRELIMQNLRDDDLVVASGGDGIANVAMDALISSEKNAIFAVIPLGNVNDFSASINGRIKKADKILSSKITNFYPLELKINDQDLLYSTQYISFGATTVLVDWLNSPEVRAARKKYHGNVARLMILGARNIQKISKNIAKINIPPFKTHDKILRRNSFGFFLGRTGKFFRPLNGKKFHKKTRRFWVHEDNFHGRTVCDATKLTNWLVRGIPGKISEYEQIEFSAPINLTCQIGGDNVPLKNISKLACQRTKKPIKILSNKL